MSWDAFDLAECEMHLAHLSTEQACAVRGGCDTWLCDWYVATLNILGVFCEELDIDATIDDAFFELDPTTLMVGRA